MDQYCVVVCGLQAGTSDDASAWRPVATALKLDQYDFARRVVAALPRIVRRELDQATADRVVQLLQAMHVDARALPDDRQLAYIDRAGTTRGPLPQSSLGEFILPGESYRLHDGTAWLPWPAPVDRAAAGTTPTIDPEGIDETTPSSTPGEGDISDAPTRMPADSIHGDGRPAPDELPDGADGEPPHATTASRSPGTWNDLDNTAEEPLEAVTGGEARHAMPLPVPTPPDDPETTAPALPGEESGHDDSLINPPQEPPASNDPESFIPMAPDAVAAEAPTPSRTGRLVVLLVLVGLAAWAYFRWTADTRVSGSPAVPATIRPSKSSSGHPAISMPAASVAKAASTTHPASTASAVVAPAATTAAPPAAAPVPAPATTKVETAVAAPSSSATPAAAGTSTIVPALPSPAATTSSATPTH